MFDFEKLIAYQKTKDYNHNFFQFICSQNKLDSVVKNQLKRASLSVMLNIAEGTSRFSKADKRNFYVIARGSVFECVAIIDFLSSESLIDKNFHEQRYMASEELSKMIFAMIRNLEK